MRFRQKFKASTMLHPVQARKLRPVVQILKSKFRDFVKNKVTFRGEFPSLDLDDTQPSVLSNNLTYKLD